MTKARPLPRCRADGCGKITGRGQLMCRAHWFQLPLPLRRAIWSTWRRREWRAYLANVREAGQLIREEMEELP